MKQKLINISTFKEYKFLNEKDRTIKKWFWPTPWYILPFAMKFNFDEEDENKSEWQKTYNFLKKEYPIQYFIRNLDELFFMAWIETEIYAFNINYWIPFKCFFKPRNKDLQKLIPNTWKSEDEIIYDILKQIFLRVYLPDKFDNWRDDTYTDLWPRLAKEADEIYKKIESIPVMEDQLAEEWVKIPVGKLKKGFTYEEIYGKVNDLESKIEQTKTDIMVWIVKNRNILDK